MINIAIVGFGNLGRGVQEAVKKNLGMELVAVFTRRPEHVKKEIGDVLVFPIEGYTLPKGLHIDVAILCGSSKTDAPVQGPEFAKVFNTVDSFDIHADIPAHFDRMNNASIASGNVSIISAGWDPGIFSLERILADAFLPENKSYTFWG